MYDIPSTTAEFNGSRRQLRGAWFGMRSLAPPHCKTSKRMDTLRSLTNTHDMMIKHVVVDA